MSYINSALRKVQKEKDSRYTAYGDLISSRRDGRRERTAAVRSWRAIALPAATAAILAILVVVAGFFYRTTTATLKVSVVPSPQRTGQPDGQAVPAPDPRQAAPVAAAGENKTLPDRAARLYEMALVAQRGQRWQEAESLYRQVLTVDPRQVKALNNLGVLCMTQKRTAEARELFLKALAIQAGYVDPYYNLACLYAQSGDIRNSLSYLERAVKINGQVRKWAKQDNDFNKMQSLPEFNYITEELVR